MKRARYRAKTPDRCLVCMKLCPEKTSHACAGWDWFTGYLGVTACFCPEHKKGELYNRLFKLHHKPQDQWTPEDRQFVAEFRVEVATMGASS